MSTPEHDWPDTLFATLLEAEIGTVAYVPDAGHARVIARAHAAASVSTVPLTTEEEGYLKHRLRLALGFGPR